MASFSAKNKGFLQESLHPQSLNYSDRCISTVFSI